MDSYRRFLNMFGTVVMDIPHHAFEAELDKMKAAAGVDQVSMRSANSVAVHYYYYTTTYTNPNPNLPPQTNYQDNDLTTEQLMQVCIKPPPFILLYASNPLFLYYNMH
jgi:hypothetical protein